MVYNFFHADVVITLTIQRMGRFNGFCGPLNRTTDMALVSRHANIQWKSWALRIGVLYGMFYWRSHSVVQQHSTWIRILSSTRLIVKLRVRLKEGEKSRQEKFVVCVCVQLFCWVETEWMLTKAFFPLIRFNPGTKMQMRIILWTDWRGCEEWFVYLKLCTIELCLAKLYMHGCSKKSRSRVVFNIYFVVMWDFATLHRSL